MNVEDKIKGIKIEWFNLRIIGVFDREFNRWNRKNI